MNTMRNQITPRPEERLMSVSEVAELIGFTRKGVYGLVETRRIPFVRIGTRIRFIQSDVLAWLQQNRVPALED